MAKSSRRQKPKAQTEVPLDPGTEAPEVPEVELYEPPAAEAAAPAKKQAGRPIGAKTGSAASNRTFFQRLEEIPADDWGSRATVHLYRLEPFTDRLRSGNVIHIMKYSEPIDESRVMADHGSGKYRAMLNFRKQSGPKSDEIGRFEFEILNTAFPPNVPLGEWVDDPRNRKWAWAKDMLEARAAAKLPPAQQQSRGVGEALETIRAVKELMPEQPQQPPPANAAADTLATIKAVRELFPAPAPQTENAMLNTVVQLFTAQIAASQEEARELRKEVRDMRQNPTGKSDGISSFKEFVGAAKELLPAIKEVFPGAGEAVAGAVTGRSRMGAWQEMFQPSLTALVQGLAPVIPMVAQQMFTRQAAPGMMPQSNPAGSNALPPGQAPQQQRNPLITFLNSITPAMLNYLKKYAAGDEESDGEMFAVQLSDMFGQLTPEGIDWHQAAQQAGVVNIVSLYRQSPYWPSIAPIEPKFIEFLTQFLAATPGAPEEEEPGATPEVIDLSKEEGEEVYA